MRPTYIAKSSSNNISNSTPVVDRRAHELSFSISPKGVRIVSRALFIATIARISLSRERERALLYYCGVTRADYAAATRRLHGGYARGYAARLSGDRRYSSCFSSATRRTSLRTERHIQSLQKIKHCIRFCFPLPQNNNKKSYVRLYFVLLLAL